MKIIGGAIVVLAGALLFSAGILGQEIPQAAGRFPAGGYGFGFLVGTILMIIGFVIMAARGRDSDHR
jgi:hypothetical protein